MVAIGLMKRSIPQMLPIKHTMSEVRSMKQAGKWGKSESRYFSQPLHPDHVAEKVVRLTPARTTMTKRDVGHTGMSTCPQPFCIADKIAGGTWSHSATWASSAGKAAMSGRSRTLKSHTS